MWMRRRVLFQALAIVIVILILVVAGARGPLGRQRLVKLNKIYTRTGDGGTPGWSTAAGSASRACA